MLDQLIFPTQQWCASRLPSPLQPARTGPGGRRAPNLAHRLGPLPLHSTPQLPQHSRRHPDDSFSMQRCNTMNGILCQLCCFMLARRKNTSEAAFDSMALQSEKNSRNTGDSVCRSSMLSDFFLNQVAMAICNSVSWQLSARRRAQCCSALAHQRQTVFSLEARAQSATATQRATVVCTSTAAYIMA